MTAITPIPWRVLSPDRDGVVAIHDATGREVCATRDVDIAQLVVEAVNARHGRYLTGAPVAGWDAVPVETNPLDGEPPPWVRRC